MKEVRHVLFDNGYVVSVSYDCIALNIRIAHEWLQ